MTDPDECTECGKHLNDDPTVLQLLDGRCPEEWFVCAECCATSELPCDECLLTFDFSERTEA